jgi:hypothetical protein
MKTYMGLQVIIDDEAMSETIEDWSAVRSPSRAKRRMKKGHNQKIVIRRVAKKEILRFYDKMVMHSEMAARLANEASIENIYNPQSRYF